MPRWLVLRRIKMEFTGGSSKVESEVAKANSPGIMENSFRANGEKARRMALGNGNLLRVTLMKENGETINRTAKAASSTLEVLNIEATSKISSNTVKVKRISTTEISIQGLTSKESLTDMGNTHGRMGMYTKEISWMENVKEKAFSERQMDKYTMENSKMMRKMVLELKSTNQANNLWVSLGVGSGLKALLKRKMEPKLM